MGSAMAMRWFGSRAARSAVVSSSRHRLGSIRSLEASPERLAHRLRRHPGELHLVLFEDRPDRGGARPGQGFELAPGPAADTSNLAVMVTVRFSLTAVSASFMSLVVAGSESSSEPGANATWFGPAAASAATLRRSRRRRLGGHRRGGGLRCTSATGVSAGCPARARLASTIPAMAITTSTATAILARVREELRVGGGWRSSMTFPSLGATDSSWR